MLPLLIMFMQPTEFLAEVQALDVLTGNVVTNATSCEDPSLKIATERLMASEQTLAEYNQLRFSPRSGAGTRYRASKVVEDSLPSLTDTHFRLADGLLKRRCLDGADLLYRDILTRFSGSSYEALRERAKVGIDDVRSFRR